MVSYHILRDKHYKIEQLVEQNNLSELLCQNYTVWCYKLEQYSSVDFEHYSG